MDKRDNNPLKLNRGFSPAGLLLAALVALGASSEADYSLVVPAAVTFYIAAAWALTLRSPFRNVQAFPSVDYLDALRGALEKMPPEAAFMESCCRFPAQPELLFILQSIYEGKSLSESMRSASRRFRGGAGTFSMIADLISFDSGAAADGIRRIAEVQREKHRMQIELQEKLSALSFRNNLLSVIGSASLAIIAFSFPLLGMTFATANPASGASVPHFQFDPAAFFSLLSASLLSPCLSSRLMRGSISIRSMVIPAAVYCSTYLILILTMGSSL